MQEEREEKTELPVLGESKDHEESVEKLGCKENRGSLENVENLVSMARMVNLDLKDHVVHQE